MTSVRSCVSAMLTTAFLLLTGIDSGAGARQRETLAQDVGKCESCAEVDNSQRGTHIGYDDRLERFGTDKSRGELIKSSADGATKKWAAAVTKKKPASSNEGKKADGLVPCGAGAPAGARCLPRQRGFGPVNGPG